ncbi:trans-aconitate 2-methyltransferase [Phycisphaerales bacterium AB-hyl4]|uniref:Trans-aconitate 2-methyltransferase n=1 Tax=Natronomicrosphaera hydrolytica TaxID=3242702 RepID=A0ABV4U3K7_9BACT
MSQTEADAYMQPYREAHEDHGSDFAVTLWASPKTQKRRFEVFTQMCFLAGKRVLDAGCSRGDFAEYLIKHDVPFGKYIGIDGLSEVIDYAEQRQMPQCEFHHGDFVTHPELLRTGKPQVIAISGTLNTMSDKLSLRVLDDAWQAAGETLIFNFLSDRCGPKAPAQLPPARRLDTAAIFEWALQHTWDVQFRQDYFQHGHDATILMRKG